MGKNRTKDCFGNPTVIAHPFAEEQEDMVVHATDPFEDAQGDDYFKWS